MCFLDKIANEMHMLGERDTKKYIYYKVRGGELDFTYVPKLETKESSTVREPGT